MATNASSSSTSTTMPLMILPHFRLSEVFDRFSDVTPVPQDDGPHLVCKIDYPPNFSQVYDVFRACLQTNETTSDRVLGLTALCLEQNPANYTVWHVRRQCLAQWSLSNNISNNNSNSSNYSWLPQELEYTASLAGSNPKNYQIWYHRRSLLQQLVNLTTTTASENQQQPTSLLLSYQAPELEYINSVLNVDGKNYHAWSHRQWLVLTLHNIIQQQNNSTSATDSLWQAELQFTERLITLDIRNNSAWNHRWFASHRGNAKKQSLLSDVDLKREVNYALDQIEKDPFNESSCRYLVALLRKSNNTNSKNVDSMISSSSLLQLLPSLIEDCLTKLHELATEYKDAAPLLSACADLCETRATLSPSLSLSSSVGANSGSEEPDWILEQASQHLNTLIQVDPIRIKYWEWRLEQLNIRMIASNSNSMEKDESS
mmetsp:Transcript_6755/g.8745  ORF Transcript_6755/g.8745 Transcript_6755/m.8745 type:complete len:430 (+) Transcript_6755:112-1401(+)